MPVQSSAYEEILALKEADATGPPCTVGMILTQLSDDELDGLMLAFDNPTVKGTVITKWLNQKGYRVSSHTVQRHRRHGCACDQED